MKYIPNPKKLDPREMKKRKEKRIADPNPTHDSIHRLGDPKPIKKKNKKSNPNS